MTEDVTREEFEALRERVAALEDELSSRDQPDAQGIDHRDKAVLDYMREHGKVAKSRLVNLYLGRTDIQNRDTAKQRAKNLETTDAYQDL